MIENLISREAELRADFREYLKNRYTGATAGVYVSAINSVASEEGLSWNEIAEDIDFLAEEYGPNGEKREKGMKNNSLIFTALRRFKQFLLENHTFESKIDGDIFESMQNHPNLFAPMPQNNTKTNLSIEVNESVLKNTERVLDNIGLSVETAVGMFLKRVERDGGIGFLTGSTNAPWQKPNIVESRYLPRVRMYENENRVSTEITKAQAMQLFKQNGYAMGYPVTYSSKNRTANNYWANPPFEVLKYNWSLILNDWVNHIIYLFIIPHGEITSADLCGRADKPSLIDLQIAYNDQNFIDTRSGFAFGRFKVDKIEY